MTTFDDPRFEQRTVYTEPPTDLQPVVPVVDERVERVVDAGDTLRVTSVAATQPAVVVPARTVVTPTVPAGSVQTTSYSHRLVPDAVIAGLAGLALLVIGLIAITRAGFDGPMATPVVQVLGFTHTTTLGLLEIAFGACLLLSGVSLSRSGALFFGIVLGIAAFVGAVQAESFRRNLALESGYAWLLVVAAIVIVASALVMPRYSTRRTVVERM